MKKITLTTLLVLISFGAYSQVKTDQTTIGIGTGLDYGGFGGNLLYYPQKNIGLFAGLGYNMTGLGYNVGTKIRLVNEKRTTSVTPYIMGMYGYNAVIKVKGASQFNKAFYGPTLGLGLDYKSSPSNNGYWTFAILVPFRGSEVDDYMTDLEDNHGVHFDTKLMPIGISIGYRIIVD